MINMYGTVSYQVEEYSLNKDEVTHMDAEIIPYSRMLRILELAMHKYNITTRKNYTYENFSLNQLQALLLTEGVNLVFEPWKNKNKSLYYRSLKGTIKLQHTHGTTPVNIFGFETRRCYKHAGVEGIDMNQELVDKMVEKGVKNLIEYGYPLVNKENIFTDMIYSAFFKKMLDETKGKGFDTEVDELISRINVNQ